MVLCACPPPDLRASGAVRRGHRGVGTADVPRACDPGAALHFPGGLSVLRGRPAVRPGERGRCYPSLAWTLWACGAGPSESSSDEMSPAHWENIARALSSAAQPTWGRRLESAHILVSWHWVWGFPRLTCRLLGLASLSEHISCLNTAAAAAQLQLGRLTPPLSLGDWTQPAHQPGDKHSSEGSIWKISWLGHC